MGHSHQTVRFKLKGKSAVNVGKVKIEYVGKSIFKFNNGDIYAGGFKIVFPQTITKHGYGMYICEDDKSVYIGNWFNDKMYHGKIRYKDGITYIGNLKNSKYHGKGNYRIPGVGSLLSYFLYNLPSAEVALVDVNGFYWTGSVSDGGGVELCPVNPFHNDPLWHDNTSEITATRINKMPIEFEIPMPERKISITNLDLKLLYGLHRKQHLNRFVLR